MLTRIKENTKETTLVLSTDSLQEALKVLHNAPRNISVLMKRADTNYVLRISGYNPKTFDYLSAEELNVIVLNALVDTLASDSRRVCSRRV